MKTSNAQTPSINHPLAENQQPENTNLNEQLAASTQTSIDQQQTPDQNNQISL